MACGADRVAHVVQAVEEGYEVVVLARERLRRRGLERDAPRETGALRALASSVDRRLVIIEPDERRARERLAHDDRRGAVAAADVRDTGAALELLAHALEGWDPLIHQVCVVAGAKEALDADEEIRIVLVPADALAG